MWKTRIWPPFVLASHKKLIIWQKPQNDHFGAILRFLDPKLKNVKGIRRNYCGKSITTFFRAIFHEEHDKLWILWKLWKKLTFFLTGYEKTWFWENGYLAHEEVKFRKKRPYDCRLNIELRDAKKIFWFAYPHAEKMIF